MLLGSFSKAGFDAQEWNSMRYAQLQEEMQQAEQELAAIEQQEIAALRSWQSFVAG